MADLLRALVLGEVPPSIRGSRFPRIERGAYPTDLRVEDGSPDEAAVEEIRMLSFRDARRWLYDVFPDLWPTLGPCAGMSVVDVGVERTIRVSTGGWSGCEEVIEAVLSHPALASYCEERRRGGGYTFVLPSP